MNRNWGIIKEHGCRKQAILVSSTVYFYLIVYFILPLLFTDNKFGPEQFRIGNQSANELF